MRPPRKSVATAAAALLLLAGAELSAQAERPLRFCVADYSPPFSTAQPLSGIDVEVARELAAHLGREAAFRWVEVHEAPEIPLLAGECDAAFGAVVDPGLMARGGAIDGISLTRPYYRTGYTLIRRADAPWAGTLTELGDARIAVEMESIPIFTLKRRGHAVYAVDDADAVVRTVARGRTDYGYLWAPLAAWLLRERSDVLPVEGFQPVPEDRWDFALAVREEDARLRSALDEAVGALMENGALERIFAGGSVDYLSPRSRPAAPAAR